MSARPSEYRPRNMVGGLGYSEAEAWWLMDAIPRMTAPECLAAFQDEFGRALSERQVRTFGFYSHRECLREGEAPFSGEGVRPWREGAFVRDLVSRGLAKKEIVGLFAGEFGWVLPDYCVRYLAKKMGVRLPVRPKRKKVRI